MGAVFGRIVTPKSGHLADTTNFAKARVAAIKKYTGVDVELRTRLGGPAGQVLMVSTHKDVGEIEALRRKIMDGVAAGEIPQPEPGMAESVEDEVWLTVD